MNGYSTLSRVALYRKHQPYPVPVCDEIIFNFHRSTVPQWFNGVPDGVGDGTDDAHKTPAKCPKHCARFPAFIDDLADFQTVAAPAGPPALLSAHSLKEQDGVGAGGGTPEQSF